MRGDGCWDDYTQRGEKNEGTRDVERDTEGDRVIRDKGDGTK